MTENKLHKQLFFKKNPFPFVEFSNIVTFWGNARFDITLESFEIIKQFFYRNLFCFESIVDIEVSKTLKHL